MNASQEYVDLIIAIQSERPQKLWVAFRETGTAFSSVDWTRSKKLANRYHAIRKECFNNCARIAYRQPELRYFEGFATYMIPVEHAWLVASDGKVLDPTFALLDHADWKPDYFGVHVPVDRLIRSENMYEPRWLKQIQERMANA